MSRVIPHAALLLDELGHPPARPQLRRVAEGDGTALEPGFDAADVLSTEQRLASGPAGRAQTAATVEGQGGSPATDRLSVNIESARHLGLAESLAQESGGLQTPFLEGVEIASDSGWVSHGQKVA